MRKLLVLLVLLLSGCVTGSITAEQREEKFDYKLVFCSEESCLGEVIRMVNSSESADCALYNADGSVISALSGREARLVLSSDSKANVSFARKRKYGIMHNKFCIFDRKTILTGSFNPTHSIASFDNIVIINSTLLAKNYQDEFEELWQGRFGKGDKTRNSRIMMNNTLVEIFFCPEDNCAGKLTSEIRAANSSIYFMSYTFTLKEVAEELLKKAEACVHVEGFIEMTGNNSVYDLLKGRISVKKQGKGLLHHKVFIIDNETVVTGSFNPTKNGNENNDENMLVIHNADVAEKYLNEFKKLS